MTGGYGGNISDYLPVPSLRYSVFHKNMQCFYPERKYALLGCGFQSTQHALSMLQEKRIYNYLGRDGFKEIQFYDKPIRLQEEDVVAIFSNGMHESVTWKEMEDCLSQKKRCRRMAFDLVELVNQKKGDKDNASVVLIKVGEMA